MLAAMAHCCSAHGGRPFQAQGCTHSNQGVGDKCTHSNQGVGDKCTHSNQGVGDKCVGKHGNQGVGDKCVGKHGDRSRGLVHDINYASMFPAPTTATSFVSLVNWGPLYGSRQPQLLFEYTCCYFTFNAII